MVTLPFVTFLMLNPTVGIMSSLNWPDWGGKIAYINNSLGLVCGEMLPLFHPKQFLYFDFDSFFLTPSFFSCCCKRRTAVIGS